MSGLRAAWILLLALPWGPGCGADFVWPPELESLFDPLAQVCTVPSCSETGRAGMDPAGNWRRTLTTTASNCPELVASFDGRAVVGHVEVTDPYAIDDVIGTCHYKEGVHIGTVKRATFAECRRSVQELEVISFETGVASFAGNLGRGKVRVYLRNLIGSQDGCEVDLDVLYQR